MTDPWDPATVTGSLALAVEDSADRPFVDFGGTVHTFGDVWALAERLAGGLDALGVRHGDTVASMLDNNVECLASWYATNLVGAIWVPVNTALRRNFLRHVLADAAPRVLIVEADLAPRSLEVIDALDAPPAVVVRGTPCAATPSGPPARSFDSVLRAGGTPMDWYQPTPNDLSLLVYTGGTTGLSKGCCNSHGYVLNVARRYLESTGRTAGELNWSPLPMFHFNVLALTLTSSVLLRSPAAIVPRFSVRAFWLEVERTRPAVVNLLGSMGTLVAQMDDTPEMTASKGTIRFVHGAPFSPETQRIWRERFGVDEIGGGIYGLTEAVPLTNLASGVPSPPGSSGRANDEDFEVRIVDDDGNPVPPGCVGEIVARPRRSNVMFKGYWRRPAETLAVLDDLWFHTGDLGRFDADGFFWFVDRKKDYLRRRGENISSIELERSFLEHPDVEEVAAHAVPSDLGEDDVKVTAVLRGGSTLTPTELFAWAVDRVPYFALPRYIEFRDSLPVSAVGRVHKYLLRDEGCTEATWDREQASVDWERR